MRSREMNIGVAGGLVGHGYYEHKKYLFGGKEDV